MAKRVKVNTNTAAYWAARQPAPNNKRHHVAVIIDGLNQVRGFADTAGEALREALFTLAQEYARIAADNNRMQQARDRDQELVRHYKQLCDQLNAQLAKALHRATAKTTRAVKKR
jgi:hypothetical protein